MADQTHIQWTDATWNPITGCSIVSKGCTNCYAMQLAGTRLKDHPSRAGLTHEVNGNHVWTGTVRFNEQWLGQPLRWTKPRRIFVCAHGDLFHESVPDAWIDSVFDTMARARWHTFQILTKRPDRMRAYIKSVDAAKWKAFWSNRLCYSAGYPKFGIAASEPQWPLPNVWLGVSIEDQATADDRVPLLLDTPAAIRFASAEPLLGPIDLRAVKIPPAARSSIWIANDICQGLAPEPVSEMDVDALSGGIGYFTPNHMGGCAGGSSLGRLNWVIVGGESGARARPMHPDWARSLRDQCAAAGVPFFFKQWGGWLPEAQKDGSGFEWAPGQDGRAHWWKPEPPEGRGVLEDGHCSVRIGKKAAGDLLDGVQHHNWPEAR